VSFPLIRPGDVGLMPAKTVERLRRRLAEECAAAAVRHGEILAARRVQRDPLWATSARGTELARCAAEVPAVTTPVVRVARVKGQFVRSDRAA
jgi:hypothetical protein